MISLEQQSDWAASLLDSLSDSKTSNCYVVGWLRANLGLLNSYLSTEFSLSGDFISPEMAPIESGIYNEMYICAWTRKKALNILGEMEDDWIEIQGEGQGKIKRVSFKEKSSAYQNLAKDCEKRLTELVKQYRGGNFARPQQITFNDRFSTPQNIPCHPCMFSTTNPVVEYFESCQ